MPNRLEFERCAPWLPVETADALDRAGIRLPLTVGDDGDVLDAAGGCVFVVDHNRERDDHDVGMACLLLVEAINAVAGYRIKAIAR